MTFTITLSIREVRAAVVVIAGAAVAAVPAGASVAADGDERVATAMTEFNSDKHGIRYPNGAGD